MASSPSTELSPVPSIHVDPAQESDWGEGLLKQFEDLSSKLKEETGNAAGTDVGATGAGGEDVSNRAATSTPDSTQPSNTTPKSSPPLSQIFEGGDYTINRSPRKTSIPPSFFSTQQPTSPHARSSSISTPPQIMTTHKHSSSSTSNHTPTTPTLPRPLHSHRPLSQKSISSSSIGSSSRRSGNGRDSGDTGSIFNGFLGRPSLSGGGLAGRIRGSFLGDFGVSLHV